MDHDDYIPPDFAQSEPGVGGTVAWLTDAPGMHSKIYIDLTCVTPDSLEALLDRQLAHAKTALLKLVRERMARLGRS